jgi:hypothetical protein
MARESVARQSARRQALGRWAAVAGLVAAWGHGFVRWHPVDRKPYAAASYRLAGALLFGSVFFLLAIIGPVRHQRFRGGYLRHP